MEISPQSLILEGRKAVLEALNHEKPIDRILIRVDGKHKPGAAQAASEAGGNDAVYNKPEGTLRLIAAKARALKIVVQEVERAKLDELSETGHHQGVIALCPAVPYVQISDILAIAEERGEQPFVIVLDGVTDPHNLGAVLRTADAGGAHGVIIPKRRAVGLTATVAKTSAGAIAHVPVARVSNVTRALEELKQAGLWVTCADASDTEGHGAQSLFDADLSGPIALVLGAEGEGVSRLVREQADFVVGIPMLGRIQSLNVSVAAGVLIYEVVRKRRSRA
ncbi:MAG: 23S rRNA (guanosine(2251)-2'-O)-methyltransferase RlmB [Defluviitaleaceae bacterium]|nr:23S rRNA (guanosine(2251)-2'-O)-methyltransferase RlmB [Defluviitaleaceae bacterium]